MSYLDRNTFAMIVANAPLVSIDLVVRDIKGQILLGERLNRPAQGSWFVPGGRIYKGETLAKAFERLTLAELGVRLKITESHYIGLFEHFYPDSIFTEVDDAGSVSTHYVVNAFELNLPLGHTQLPYEQHNNYRWFSETELLSDSRVHRHSQWYFMPAMGVRG